MGSSEQHELVAVFKKLKEELGRAPKLYEMKAAVKGLRHKLDRSFEGKLERLAAAASESTPLTERKEAKLIRQYKSLCSKREQIQGFFRSVLDLEEIFERAGNPEVVRFSVQPDTHGKFADMAAFRCYLRFLQYFKPHGHVILGDFADCEGLSHWPDESLEPRRIVPEMKICRQLLTDIVEATPECSTRIFLEGNHERWIEMALTRMPELFDGLAELDIEISLKTLLALDKFGYQLFPLNELVQIGKAHFTHGLYTPTHHAKKHMDVLKCNVYYGHLHDTQEANQTSVDGPMEAASLGCLCRLDAKFLKGKPNNWQHAHGVFEFFRDGSYNFYKIRIINGRTAFNGIVFDGNE